MSDAATKNSKADPSVSKKAGFKKWLIENVISLGTALIIVFAIRSSVIEAFKIPSGSMIPTLLVGDHIFVNKFSYGFKVPFTDWFLDEPIYTWTRSRPTRGDIIVFKYPRDESFYYIKRVIGIPGDSIEVRNKQLFVNQKPVPKELLTGDASEKTFRALGESRFGPGNTEAYMESLSDVRHTVFFDKQAAFGDNFGPYTVPNDHYFVMGDNRDFSNDSRFWGTVPMKNVRGKAMVIWLSIWINLDQKEFSFHPERIGTLLK